MTGNRAAAPLAGGVALLERAITYTLGSLCAVTPRALSRPTPCTAWDLRALLDHLDDSLAALHEAIDLGHVDLDIPRQQSAHPADPAAAVRDRARRLLGAWTHADRTGPVSIAGNPLAAGIVTRAGAIEITAHGWDVATACGHHHPIPRPLAEDLLPLLPLFITDDDRPARFAAPVGIPHPATPADRLIAYLGRTPT